MEVCKHCGHEMGGEETFCTECGAPKDAPLTRAEAKAPKAPMPRKKKITLISIGAVLVILLTAHLILSSMLDPTTKIRAMDRAVTNNDAGAFVSELSLDEKAWLNEKEYLQYMKENDWETIREQMLDAVSGQQRFDTIIRDEYGSPLLSVKKTAVIPGMYKTYEIEAVPTEIRFLTNMDDASFTVGEEKITVENAAEDEVNAKAYPGVYKVEGEASNVYGKFKDTWEYQVLAEESDYYMELYFAGTTYDVDTNQPEAILFVNGKSTKKSLDELGVIGPVPDGNKLVLHAEWTNDKKEVVKSGQIRTYDGDYWGELSFYFEEELEEPEESVFEYVPESDDSEAAEAHVLDFREVYEEALNAEDFSMIAPFLEDGSQASAEFKDYLDGISGKGFTYAFTENNIVKSTAYGVDGYVVTTDEAFIFTDSEGEKTHYERTKDYTVIKDGDSWKIEEVAINETNRSDG
ncbi:hypothetical protein GLW04_12785 [Halobacillus litoralis]|uniref:Zinc ribbon domain-containing protein n=1 Tax=Halobacillus litoralis TaxID=45668 RepID=A0A845DTF9_9BACI|nr:hypothetical protein [Halobacillus litoralis]MYL20770.1 hypothetical protein [Halobacillus litoralis]